MTDPKSRVDGPVKLVMWVACLFTVLMMAHITVDVTLRVLFNAPLTGTFEVVANYYMVAVMYLPLAYVSRHEGQIIVELFTRNMGERRLLRWDVVANAITALYVAVFAVYTGIKAVEQTELREVKETGDTFMEIWPARWLLPIAFGLMAIYLVVRIRQDVHRARDFEPPVSA
jgi:TRAP-type C4-dicarboxylate transport system permease small subunit